MTQRQELLAYIIDFLRDRGVPLDSPYDLENFFEAASHTEMFATGRFAQENVEFEYDKV